MKIRNILFLFMGLLLVTSCTFRLSKEDKETMSQTLSVKPFEKVDVIGAYEVIYVDLQKKQIEHRRVPV